MPHREGAAWERITQDTILARSRVVFYGLLVLASATGGEVNVYDGRDAGASRLFARVEGEADISVTYVPPVPVVFERGLFIDVGSNITEVTVFYRPLE